MEQTPENDHALVAVVFMLTGIVFVLDLLTPSELLSGRYIWFRSG